MTRYTPLAAAALAAAALAAPAAASADVPVSTVASVRVAAHTDRTVVRHAPSKVRDIAISVNGMDAMYERVSGCVAYFARRGVVGRIDACGHDWRIEVTNTMARGARVSVQVS